MKIINESIKINKNIISKSYYLLDKVWDKAKGLMFCKKVKRPLIFVFNNEQIISLHMFFVFTTIDVIYLDKNKRVIELKQNFKPFTFYNPKNKAKFIIETEKNTIKKYNIKLNEKAYF